MLHRKTIRRKRRLLKEINWTADCFVLNPPWRLFWPRDRLKDLENSECVAVADVWKADEDTAPRGTMDSTIATLMMALPDIFRLAH